jgi:mRNA interferase MazF
MKIQQKDICLANLNPTQGSEQAGKCPVAVISGNTMNSNLSICIVCPISASVKNYPTCVEITPSQVNKLKNASEVLTFQIRAISQKRIVKKIGQITDKEFAQIIAGLRDVIAY